MTALIIPDVSQFPILSSEGDFYWNPTNNTVSGVYWLQLEVQTDLDNAAIAYTIGEIEIVEPIIED
jgi:subtilase family serine protease